MKAFRSLVALTALAFSSSALAGPVYEYSIDNPNGSANAGDITNVTTTFDAGSDLFTWSYSIEEKSPGVFSDSFWLVVSDGPNPKGTDDQLAIIYGDLDANTLTVYNYHGQNNPNSFQTGALLGSFTNAMTITQSGTEQTTSFSLDASGINAETQFGNDWEGIQFADKVGIWFHPSIADFTYDGQGGINTFIVSSQGWYDTADRTTVLVPTPPLAALLMLGLAGIFLGRRRNA